MDREYGCKVCRILDERGLPNYDERLRRKWQGEDGERMGYRTLARWLNVTLLRREMDSVGLSTVGEEAAAKYDRLTADDASASEITDLLGQKGIDVSALRSDFVSYGVVRTHLRECLGAEYEPATPTDWEPESITIAREHAADKVRAAVSSLATKDRLRAGSEPVVHVDVEVECEQCHTRVPVSRALRRGAVCRCATPEAVAGE